MYERYVELLNEKGVKNIDVSRATGIPASTFSDWKKGKSSPKREKLEKLAEFFDVTADWIAGTSDCKTKEDWFRHCDDVFNTPELQADLFRIETGTKIPVLGEVAAGQPIFATENYEDYYTLPKDFHTSDELFMLTIKGNSMQNVGILNGDKIVVKKQNDADNGDIVVALLDDSATCKRFFKKDNKIILHPENEDYSDIIVSDVQILGKVVGLIRKF